MFVFGVCLRQHLCEGVNSGQRAGGSFLFDHEFQGSNSAIRIGNWSLYLLSRRTGPVFLGLFLVFWSGFIIAMKLGTFVPSPPPQL